MKTTSAIFGRFAMVAAAYKQLAFFRWLVWITVVVACISICSLFFKTQNILFAFTGETCLNSNTVLPKFYKNTNQNIAVRQSNTITFFGYPVLSRQTCFSLLKVPVENSKVSFAVALAGPVQKKYEIGIPEYPNIKGELLSVDKIPTQKPIQLSLTKPDSFFRYTLSANKSGVSCQAQTDRQLSCDISKLNLEHAKAYDFTLSRQFKNADPIHVVSEMAETVTPVSIIKSSIKQGEVRYDAPAQIVLTTDKTIAPQNKVSVFVGGTLVATKSEVNQKEIYIRFEKSLPRGAVIKLLVDNLTSPDGSTLANAYELQFKTSLGPQIVSKNISDRAVGLSSSIRLTFDQNLQVHTDINKFFKLSSNSANIPFKATVSGKTVTIDPLNNLGFCQVLSIKIDDLLPNSFGISGGSAWSYNSRTTCAIVFSVGSSVKGRAITAYKFGNGPKVLLFTGTVHGDEANSKRLLDKWIYELQGNPQKIPAGKSLLIVPVANPDGYALGTRVNANNVDINRNFPASNWKSSVKMPSGQVLPQGGGIAALSEPESQVLAGLISTYAPKLIMSYHSKGGVAVANDAAGAWGFAKTYGNLSGYSAETNASLGNFFAYDTTGAFEDWLADKKGLPAVLVELASRESDEFSRNKNAMWQMVLNY